MMHTLQELRSGALAGVTHLKISEGLTTFPLEILELADTLEYLDLSGNSLSSLPAAFAGLHKLKIAFFSGNPFTVLPEVLGACPALEMLGIKSGRIGLVPENSLAPTLRWLILTDNQITDLPASIGNCRRMQKLMLAGNQLKSLPDSLAACRNLELLRISANDFSVLPPWLKEMPRLAWLAFAGNPVSQHADPAFKLAEIPWEQLQVLEQLGAGASGTIYQARWQMDDALKARLVAVKIFKGNMTSDGLPDNEMVATVQAGLHPNLVPVLGKVSKHPEAKKGLVLELIPSTYRNLGLPPDLQSCTRDLYPEETLFSRHTLLRIAEGIAAAAAHLHQQGIMHGDLYAHNILADERAHPLLSDFGAATFYSKSRKENAWLEKLEVRAFGYLLEDLLEHLAPDEKINPEISRLQELKTACLSEIPAERPGFETLASQLKAMLSEYLAVHPFLPEV